MTTITAVITTHNRIKLLPRSLDSVVNQTRAADEIMVIDDGSSDGSDQFIRNCYPNVRYIYQEHSGISAARNTAIRRADSEWLAFLDDDDAWHPEKLDTQLKALDKQPEYRLCHSDEIWIRNGRRVNATNKHKKQGGWIYPQCLPMCVISPSSVVIHRSVFEDVGLFDEDLPACEDYDLWLRICAREPVLLINQALIRKYGGHEDQLSRKHWGMDRFRIQSLEKILSSNTLNTEYRQATLQMLIEKIVIYINGARKRGKEKEVSELQKRLITYQQSYTVTQDKLSCC